MIPQSTSFLLGSVFGLGGSAVVIASRYLPRPRTTPTAVLPAPVAGPVYRQCDSPVCGHMTTPHDPTPIGHVCRQCGRTEAPHA